MPARPAGARSSPASGTTHPGLDALPRRWADPMADLDRDPDGPNLVELIARVCANEQHAGRNRDLLPLLALRPGQAVLEVGCGTGALLRELAGLVPGVRMTGVDPSALALTRARADLAAGDGAPLARVVLARMDGRRLAFADGAFDAAVSSRVLIHADGPERIVAELVRVVRPGGRILCVEPAHQFFAGVDDALRERTMGFTSTGVGREVAGFLRRAGADPVTVTPHTFVGEDPPDLDALRAELAADTGMLAAALRAGRCTAEDIAELFRQIAAATERRTFLFCSLHFAVLGHRPDS